MKITKRRLRRVIKEEVIKALFESSRAGESHDAGYEDGSRGLDPRYPDDMDYMMGYEMGEEDAEYDVEVRKEGGQELDEYGRGDFGDRSKKPTAQDMGCRKHPRTGEQLEPYWQDRMRKWVCP